MFLIIVEESLPLLVCSCLKLVRYGQLLGKTLKCIGLSILKQSIIDMVGAPSNRFVWAIAPIVVYHQGWNTVSVIGTQN